MSRRRSADPTKAISITLPLSLLEQIDDKLTRKQSRSLWIADACSKRLSASLAFIPEDKRLLVMAMERLPPGTLRDLLFEYVDTLTS